MTTMIRTTYPDEYIERWGEVYRANPGLLRRGVLFWSFLAAPEEILAAHMNTPAPMDLELVPLLPCQRKLQARLALRERSARIEFEVTP